jgi:four helix bundle protein
MAVARRYEELEVWQLADGLKTEVYDLVASGPASQDFKFRNQIRDSAASATKNISEGFGRFRPADFARFMEFAVASLMETKDSLKDGLDRGYFTPARVATAQQLAERSIKCSVKFIVYLKGAAQKRRRRAKNDEPRTKNDEPRT